MRRLLFRLPTFSFALAVLGITCLACTIPVPQPQPPKLTIAIQAKGRAHSPTPKTVVVHADAPVAVQVDDSVAVETAVHVPAEPPPPAVPMALSGAAVVEFFGIPLDGAQDLVFVLDRSGSMEELARGQIVQLAGPPVMQAQPSPPPPASEPSDALEAPNPSSPDVLAHEQPLPESPRKIDIAHAELVDALQRLPAGTRMNLLFFNHRLEAAKAKIAPLVETDREHLIGFVLATSPNGPTALALAMRTAFLLNARRIVLLSDGLGNIGGDAQSVLRDAREAMRGGVRIDTIGLGQNQDTGLLQTLARESGGIYQPL